MTPELNKSLQYRKYGWNINAQTDKLLVMSKGDVNCQVDSNSIRMYVDKVINLLSIRSFNMLQRTISTPVQYEFFSEVGIASKKLSNGKTRYQAVKEMFEEQKSFGIQLFIEISEAKSPEYIEYYRQTLLLQYNKLHTKLQVCK